MHKWYVVQALAGQEKKAKRNLEEFRGPSGMLEQIDSVVVPSENVAEVKGGEQRVVERRIWPGYLLVKMELTDESWAYVKNTNGVIGFLGGEHPQALDEEEVAQLLADLERKAGEVTHKHQFEVGEHVKVVEGFFTNFNGTVIDVNLEKGRLSVQVSIFGRETRVDDLEFSQVERLPDEEVEV